MDRQLREHARARDAGDPSARLRLLDARLRAGELTGPRIQLAAFLGHGDSRAVLGSDAPDLPGSVFQLMGGLIEHDWALCLWAATRGVDRVLPLYEEVHPANPDPRNSLEALHAWLHGTRPLVLDSAEAEAEEQLLAEHCEAALDYSIQTHEVQRFLSDTPPFATDPEGAAAYAIRALHRLHGAWVLWLRSDLHPAGMEAMARESLEFAVRAVIARRVGIAHQRVAPGYDTRALAQEEAVRAEQELISVVVAPIVGWLLAEQA